MNGRGDDTLPEEENDTIPVKEAASASLRNRAEIEAADECACYHCLRVFPSSEVTTWTDQGRTAICPRCGVDAVIPKRVASARLLRHMQAYWFPSGDE